MDALSAWLQRHDLTIDLITVWVVVASALVIACGLFMAAWTLRGTHDQTAVGRTLKRQKVALAVAFLANGLYWGAILLAYYTGSMVSLWEKVGLRLVFAGGMLIGAVFVALFVRSLRLEIGRPQYGMAPLVEAHRSKKGGR